MKIALPKEALTKLQEEASQKGISLEQHISQVCEAGIESSDISQKYKKEKDDDDPPDEPALSA